MQLQRVCLCELPKKDNSGWFLPAGEGNLNLLEQGQLRTRNYNSYTCIFIRSVAHVVCDNWLYRK